MKSKGLGMTISPEPVEVRFDEDISIAELRAGRGDQTGKRQEAA